MASEELPRDGDAARDPAAPREAAPGRRPRRLPFGLSGGTPQPLPVALALACQVIALEVLALAGLGVYLVGDTIAGRASHAAFGLLSALFALGAAAILYLGARGLARLSVAARTPVVVLQVLALPVAYTMAFDAHRVALGGPIFLAALVVLYLLFTPPVRAVLDRDPPR